MAEVLIKYKADAGDLEAIVNKINKVNDDVVKSATDSSKRVSDEFKKIGATAVNAFANQQLSGAVKNLNTQVAGLLTGLRLNTDALKKFDNATDNTTDSLKDFDDEVKKTNKILVQSAQDVAKYEDRLRELSVAGQRNTDEFKDIAKAVGEYKSAIIAADRAVDLYAKSTDAATGRIGELEDKLYDLALAGKANTKEFNDLVKEVATVRRAVIETDAQVDALAQRGAKLKGFVQSVELVGVAFQAVEGAAALTGKENEELQKTLVRLQAIMAITSALEQGRVIIMEQLAAKTGIAGLAMKAYTFVTNGAATATKIWRGLLVASGIGAVVAILGTLASKFLDNKEATNEAAEAANKLAEANQNVANSVAEAAAEQELAAIRLAKAQGNITDATAKRAEVEAKVNEDLRKNQLQTLSELTDARTKYNENIKAIQEKFADDERNLIGSVQIEQRNFEEQRAKIIEAGAKRASNIRTNSIAEVIEFENDLADKAEQANKRNQKAAEKTKKEYEALKISVGNVTEELLKQDAVITQTLAANRVSAAEAAFSKIQLLNQQGLATAEDVSNAEIELIQQRAIAQLDASELSQSEKLKGVTEGSILETEIIKAGESERQAITNAAELEIFNKKKEFRDKNAAERKKDREAEIEEIFQIANALADYFNNIIQLQAVQSQARIDEINSTSEAEKIAIQKASLSEADRQRQLEALRIRTEQKIAAEKRKQAIAEKASAIFNATINTAAAVAKNSANPFLAAITAAAGLAQIAIIAATPIPKFKRGGMVGGLSHDAGGTLIEAERGEFVVNRNAVTRHRSELDALNTSSAAFKRLIDERYVRPALNYYMGKKDKNVIVNASLNSKGMEKKLDRLNKTMSKQRTIVNINGNDSRYAWHLN